MAGLTSNENEVVQTTVSLIQEFDIGSFISNSVQSLNKNVSSLVTNMKLSEYSTLITKCKDNVVSLDTIDMKNIKNSIIGVKNIEDYNITVKTVNINEIGQIKPQYLYQFVENIARCISKIINNSLDKEIIDQLTSEAYLAKVKRQMVQTDLPYNISAKDIINYGKGTVDFVNDSYINNVLVPFLDKYLDIRTKLIKEITDSIICIDKIDKEVNTYLASVNKIKDSGIDAKTNDKLNYLLYNLLHTLIDATSFLSYMIIRKTSDITNMVITASNIYDTFGIVTTGVATEGTFTRLPFPTDTNSLADDIVHGRIDCFSTIANDVVQYNQGLLSNNLKLLSTVIPGGNDQVESEINAMINNSSYDRNPYDEASKMYIIISNGLDILAKNSDDYLMVFDGIIQKAGFSLRLSERFRSTIDALDDIQEYTSSELLNNHDTTIYLKILHEISDYPILMDQIANNIVDCKAKIDMLKDRFENNINGEFKNAEAINELKIFMTDITEQYATLAVGVAGKLMNRLKNLSLIANNFQLNINKNEEDEVEKMAESAFSAIDDIYYNSIYEFQESMTDFIFDRLTFEYAIAREQIKTGRKLIVEADENNSSTDSKGGKVNTIIDSITKWFEETISKLDDVVKKFQSIGVAEYFKENKEDLLNKRYANVSNKKPIINYERLMPSSKISSDLSAVANRTSTGYLTPQKLQSLDTDELIRSSILPNIPKQVWDNYDKNGKSGRIITDYYKNNVYPENPVTFKNGELKEVVQDAVNYSSTFLSSTYPTLKNNVEKIKNNLANAVKSLVTESGFDSAVGSVFIEEDTTNNNQHEEKTNQTNTQQNQTSNTDNNNAQQNNTNNNQTKTNDPTEVKDSKTDAKNTITNMSSKCSDVQKLVQMYCNAVLTASFERFKDYLNLCYSIIPKATKSENNNNTDSDTQNNNVNSEQNKESNSENQNK